MEIRVSIAGIPREVCGVIDTTTTEEVINVLVNAGNLQGTYSLIAIWRGNEITLSRNEKPLNVINRLGEHPKEIELILRRVDLHVPTDTSYKSRSRLPVSPVIPSSSVRKSFHQACLSGPATSPSLPRRRTDNEASERERLQEQLALQEHEVEMNSIKLSYLDKEIGRLEASQLGPSKDASETAIGMAAELAQLASVNWSTQLEEQRVKQSKLIEEQTNCKNNLATCEKSLAQARLRLTKLESEVAQELTRLLDSLENAVGNRRATLDSLLGEQLVVASTSLLPTSSSNALLI